MEYNIGDRIGKLVITGETDPCIVSESLRIKQYICHCDCGNDCIVMKTGLSSGIDDSCGCLHPEWTRKLCKIITWMTEIDKFVTELGFKKDERFSYLRGNLALNLYDSDDCSSLVPYRTYVQYPKDKKYLTFSEAKKDGYRLISIFQFEWELNKEKIKSLIKDSIVYDTLYARDLDVRKVDRKVKKRFIDQYHLNGDSPQGSIAYGLYNGDQLVSCMTFGPCRGQSSHRGEGHYELVRFASQSGIKVVGGASRLFKHFVRDYNPSYIICYSDNDYYTGATYELLGFTLLDEGRSIDYVWLKGSEVLQRQTCQPWKLRKKYPELVELRESSGERGSEEDFFMLYLGYSKFYRCGNSRREWKSSSSDSEQPLSSSDLEIRE